MKQTYGKKIAFFSDQYTLLSPRLKCHLHYWCMQKKAIDREEAALRAVMECIKDCNLESEYRIIILSSKIAKRVGTLEKMAKSDGLKLEQSKKRKNNNVAPQCPPITG